MSVLQTIPDIAKTAGVSREQVRTALKHAGIEPTHSVKTGSRTMTLYDSQVAAKAVEGYVAELARLEDERRAAEAKRQADEAKPLSLAAIAEAVEGLIKKDSFSRDHALITIEATVSDTQISIDKLTELVTKLADQNVLLFRAMSAMEADHTGRLARLQNSMVDMQRGETAPPAAPVPPAPAPAVLGVRITPLPPLPPEAPAPSAMSQALNTAVRTAAAAAAAKPAKKLPRVVLIGARGNDRAAIEREFKECFELRCLEGQNHGAGALENAIRNCDRVVLAFGSSSVTAVKTALRGSGVNVVHVNGGMSRLREALTQLYVDLAEAVPA